MKNELVRMTVVAFSFLFGCKSPSVVTGSQTGPNIDEKFPQCSPKVPQAPDPIPADFDWTPVAKDWCSQLKRCGIEVPDCEKEYVKAAKQAAETTKQSATFSHTLSCEDSLEAQMDPEICKRTREKEKAK